MIFGRKKLLQRSYVSDIDQFLKAFDKKPEASSVSRRAEEAKYREIARLRDGKGVPQ
jgi:hypothetical protein